MSRTIRVSLVMEEKLLQDALSSILSSREDIRVVSEHTHVKEAIENPLSRQSDLIVIDINPKNDNSLHAISKFNDAAPDCQVLALIDRAIAGNIPEALGSSVQGFLSRATRLATFIASIHRITSGQQVVEPALAQAALLGGDNPLTKRERDVMHHIMHGMTGKEVADWLHLGEGTVRNYTSTAMAKLGARTRVDAIRICKQAGWL